jgi:predicted tellurium resistance membrane protein TerC
MFPFPASHAPWSVLGLTNGLMGQQFEWGDLVVVGMLVLLEGVLSIDNALVLGLLAKRLPLEQRPKALSYGLIGAFVFRVLAIGTASFLLRWTFVKLLGGGYLIFIAVKHLFFEGQEEEGQKLVLDRHGHPVLVDEETGRSLTTEQEAIEIRERVPIGVSLLDEDDAPEASPNGGRTDSPDAAGKWPTAVPAGGWRSGGRPRSRPSFWGTVAVIELTDVAFAVDSILAAMALAGSRQEKLWVVITGGVLGVVLMRFAAALFVRLLDRFPRFEVSAYLLVIVIGLKLVADWGCNSDWGMFAATAPGPIHSAATLESRRRDAIVRYEQWLETSWPLTAGGRLGGHHGEADRPGDTPESHHAAAEPVPHLLDFHDLRRPECLGFWLAMALCFAIGFIPKRTDSPGA